MGEDQRREANFMEKMGFGVGFGHGIKVGESFSRRTVSHLESKEKATGKCKSSKSREALV